MIKLFLQDCLGVQRVHFLRCGQVNLFVHLIPAKKKKKKCWPIIKRQQEENRKYQFQPKAKLNLLNVHYIYACK